jgi:hypothetical protein
MQFDRWNLSSVAAIMQGIENFSTVGKFESFCFVSNFSA